MLLLIVFCVNINIFCSLLQVWANWSGDRQETFYGRFTDVYGRFTDVLLTFYGRFTDVLRTFYGRLRTFYGRLRTLYGRLRTCFGRFWTCFGRSRTLPDVFRTIFTGKKIVSHEKSWFFWPSDRKKHIFFVNCFIPFNFSQIYWIWPLDLLSG